MNMMEFDHPYVFFALLIFIPLIILEILSHNRKNILKLPPELNKKLVLSAVFFNLFIALLIFALCGPRWGTSYANSGYYRGLDAVFAFDLSRSMDIRDAQIPSSWQSESDTLNESRLKRGVSIVSESAVSVPGARFAAVLGRSRGYQAVPLTFDSETVINFLASLDTSSMTGRSTNLEALLDAASGSFNSGDPAKKVIVLVSDGESHHGITRNAVNRCARQGILIAALAVGSDEGMPVPGAEAFSKRNVSVMRTAAERTGGVFIDGGSDSASSDLASYLLSFTSSPGFGSGASESKQRHTFFIILALAAYAVSKFLPLLPSGKNFRKSLVLITALFFISCSEGKLLLLEANYLFSQERYEDAVIPYQKALQYEDSAPYAEYGLGLTLYLLDEENAALKRYGNSKKLLDTLSESEHRELRYRNFYNSGIIFFEKENYDSAAEAFREALRVNPGKIEAKRNLEITLLSIDLERKQESPPDNARSETREILFDYIKQQEQQYWKSGEWMQEENLPEFDY